MMRLLSCLHSSNVIGLFSFITNYIILAVIRQALCRNLPPSILKSGAKIIKKSDICKSLLEQKSRGIKRGIKRYKRINKGYKRGILIPR